MFPDHAGCIEQELFCKNQYFYRRITSRTYHWFYLTFQTLVHLVFAFCYDTLSGFVQHPALYLDIPWLNFICDCVVSSPVYYSILQFSFTNFGEYPINKTVSFLNFSLPGGVLIMCLSLILFSFLDMISFYLLPLTSSLQFFINY